MDNLKELKEKEREILKEAKALIEKAYASARGYEDFIKILTKAKNIGSKNAPYWVEVPTPYMTVDGRIKMMVDEHRGKGTYTIHPAVFTLAPDGNTLLCSVTVETIKGTVTAHAKVGLNGQGVDATNPYENAETSALGRALSFLGYGLIGTGVASYEEVRDAIYPSHNSNYTSYTGQQTPSLPPKQPSNTQQPQNEPLSAALKVRVKQALVDSGKTEKEAIEVLNGLKTKDEAMKVLEEIGKQKAEAEKNEEQPAEYPTAPAPQQAPAQAHAPAQQTQQSQEKVKTKDLLAIKKALVEKIGEDETRKVLPTISTVSDLERVKAQYGVAA